MVESSGDELVVVAYRLVLDDARTTGAAPAYLDNSRQLGLTGTPSGLADLGWGLLGALG